MKKLFLFLVLCLMMVGVASAATINVPFDQPTIQAAISAAIDGDTINVAAGTYTENINVNKALTLTGASSATVTVNAASPSVSVFTVNANNVEISGFTVSGATGGGQAGIFLSAGVANCDISNNVLTNNFDGIWLGSGSNHNTLTSNTLSTNYQGFEVYISSDNTFTNNIANSNTKYGFKIDSGNQNTFTGNTANSNGDKGFYLVAGDGGGSTNNIFINNIANLNTRHGIHLIGSNVGVTLTENTFNENLVTGIKLQDTVTKLNMQNNKITNNPIGIGISNEGSPIPDVSTWIVSKNKITENTVGISNAGTGTLNARLNYWGTNVETEINNFISGNVDYKPYFNDEDLTELNLFSIGGIVENPDGTQNITLPTEMNLTVETEGKTIEISIPAGTIIKGLAGWTGELNTSIITIPTILPTKTDYTMTIGKTMEIGMPDMKLVFDKAVRILIPGETGKLIGYARTGEPFTQITTICLADTQAAGNALPEEGDCYYDDGTNIIIWTKHFTEFTTYKQTYTPATNTVASSNSRRGGGELVR